MKVADVLQPLSVAPLQSYMSDSLQVFDVLEWCVAQMHGPVDIYQSSFSISEEYLRRLYFYRKKGAVRNVSLVLDYKATQKTLRLWPFICKTIEAVYLSSNHSKVILIEGDIRVAIITSQNLTRGNRMESAVITTDAAVYDNLYATLFDVSRKHSVPLHELYKAKLYG